MANPVAVTAQAVDIDSDRSTDSIPLETIPEPWIVLDSTSTIGQICTNLQRFRKSVRGYNTVYKSGGLESPLGCSKNVETCNGSCNSQHSVTDLIWNEPRELIRISTKIEDSFQSLRRVPPIWQDELLLSIPLTDKFLSLCYDNSKENEHTHWPIGFTKSKEIMTLRMDASNVNDKMGILLSIWPQLLHV